MLAFLVFWVVVVLWRNGASWLNQFDIRDISSYTSPDGAYSLDFQQRGDPVFPFGPANVRLVLRDENGKKIRSVDTAIQDDGGNASEYNVKSVTWGEESVTVVLRASEMSDTEIEILYAK